MVFNLQKKKNKKLDCYFEKHHSSNTILVISVRLLHAVEIENLTVSICGWFLNDCRSDTAIRRPQKLTSVLTEESGGSTVFCFLVIKKESEY